MAGVSGGARRNGNWFGRIVLGEAGLTGKVVTWGSGNGELFHRTDVVLVVQEVQGPNNC